MHLTLSATTRGIPLPKDLENLLRRRFSQSEEADNPITDGVEPRGACAITIPDRHRCMNIIDGLQVSTKCCLSLALVKTDLWLKYHSQIDRLHNCSNEEHLTFIVIEFQNA